MGTVLEIALGVLVVVLITALTGYFVAQEFGYMAVDRSRLKAGAEAGDRTARRALGITRRTSFMLSGAQLGITVTGLLVGYVAEPLIGEGVGELLGGVGVPTAVGVATGTGLALLLATGVQMVFGELFPKNLAIARPEATARRLALSTTIYLRMFGWLIRLFDQSSNLLLRALRIEPVHDVEHAATPRDLEAIIDESRDSGDLPAALSALLDRTLEFGDRTARAAMIPRPAVASAPATASVAELAELMATGHSRYPVLDPNGDDVIGVVCLRDVLALTEGAGGLTAGTVARAPVLVPSSLPLPAVLDTLRAADDELACVLDEYGGLAGIITVEDIAEELVGEITDEHDPPELDQCRGGDGDWTVPGSLHVDDVGRLIGSRLPEGQHQTIAGLVLDELQRLPAPGDEVTVALPPDPAEIGEGDGPAPGRHLRVRVLSLARRVPRTVHLSWADTPADTGADTGADAEQRGGTHGEPGR